MREFLVLCTIAVITAAPQEYTYQHSLPFNQYTGRFGELNQMMTQHQYAGATHTFPSLQGTNSQHNTLSQSSEFVHGYSTAQRVIPAAYEKNHIPIGSHYDLNHKSPIITKHFYIHSAPEEIDDDAGEKTITLGRPRKHYRIVFIRAPVESSRPASLTFSQAENEEKTVIYVLSKKTNPSDIQTDFQARPTVPSKPEVFFIKYKTPEEADHAQKQIQDQYDSLGGTSNVSDEGYAPVTSVIGALDHSSRHDTISTTHTISNNSISQSGYLPPSQ